MSLTKATMPPRRKNPTPLRVKLAGFAVATIFWALFLLVWGRMFGIL